MVVVADGTENARERLERVLTTDPGTGVMRHADAGYERALEVARGTRGPDPDARAVTDRHIVAMGGGGFSWTIRSWIAYVLGLVDRSAAEGVLPADRGQRGACRT